MDLQITAMSSMTNKSLSGTMADAALTIPVE
jgi:hypothetical protein